MLDERTGKLLFAINECCEKGSFKIVEESELLSCFPRAMQIDGEGLKAMLAYLQDRGYVEIGYAEEGEYCVRPMPEGRLYFERKRSEKRERWIRRLEAFLLALFGGFAGGFLGALTAILLPLG